MRTQWQLIVVFPGGADIVISSRTQTSLGNTALVEEMVFIAVRVTIQWDCRSLPLQMARIQHWMRKTLEVLNNLQNYPTAQTKNLQFDTSLQLASFLVPQ